MSESDLNKMEAGARAATQGEWVKDVAWATVHQAVEYGNVLNIADCRNAVKGYYGNAVRSEIREANASHIANCSPPAIISMINDIRNLRKELAKKNTELFHTEQATGCQAHEMGSIAPCICRHEMGG